MKDLTQLMLARPFKVRNADEFDLAGVLHRFINPRANLYSPFEYESSILRGKKGTGKTMYLRANYALYQYDVYAGIADGRRLHIPIFLSLSKFQHIKDPEKLYRAIMLSLCENLIESYANLLDSNYMRKVHMGMRSLPDYYFSAAKIREAGKKLLKMNVENYVETIEARQEGVFGAKAKFIEMMAKVLGSQKEQFTRDQSASISSLIDMQSSLLEGCDADILILLDEAGSLHRSFFEGDKDDSMFEVMLNQFRTTESIRCKVAVYPNAPSDKVSDTRYGDRITLEDDIGNANGYKQFRAKTLCLIDRYINEFYESPTFLHGDLFEVEDQDYGDCIEQIIYGSAGNMRLLVQLLDLATAASHQRAEGKAKVSKADVELALSEFSYNTLSTYSASERDLLIKIAAECKRRTAFRFTYKYNTLVLNRLAQRSEEYNLVEIMEFGSGRAPTKYNLDYCTCVREKIPTHVRSGESASAVKINHERSLANGQWNKRVCALEATGSQDSCADSITGNVVCLPVDNKLGSIIDEVGTFYHFFPADVKNESEDKKLEEESRVSFIPVVLADGQGIAHTIVAMG